MLAIQRNNEAGKGQRLVSVAPVKIIQEDLSTIVDGLEEDAEQNRPFDHVFTKENILKAWTNIGYVLFTRKCIENKKVRYELQESKATAAGT